MIPDYYKILKISPDASLDDIKKAYRVIAMKYHPDRGGNHNDMVLINQAWGILSDPRLRQDYDYARTHQYNLDAQERASKEADQARNRAETYPQNWNQFEAWLDELFKEYGKSDFYLPYGIKPPFAGRSFSGWIFILIGAALGLYIAFSILPPRGLKSWQSAIAWGLIGAGAWLGAIIHKIITGSPTKKRE